MDCKRIESLLEKFWACQTTLEEEEELRCFFCHDAHTPLSENLRRYRTLFVYQEMERDIRPGGDFENKILSKLQEKRPLGKKWIKWTQVAALVLLFLGGVHLWREHSKTQAELTPEEALAEVRQALDFVSQKLNRSQQLLEQNLEEIECINRYIKK